MLRACSLAKEKLDREKRSRDNAEGLYINGGSYSKTITENLNTSNGHKMFPMASN